MMPIFNKQFRTEEKIFSDLRKKIRKSETIANTHHNDKYALDSIVIDFDVSTHRLTVSDKKTGSEIITIDCHFDNYDDMQKIRSNWFHNLLMFVREQFNKRQAKIKKVKDASEKLTEKNRISQTRRTAQTAQATLLENALDKLKALNK